MGLRLTGPGGWGGHLKPADSVKERKGIKKLEDCLRLKYKGNVRKWNEVAREAAILREKSAQSDHVIPCWNPFTGFS